MRQSFQTLRCHIHTSSSTVLDRLNFTPIVSHLLELSSNLQIERVVISISDWSLSTSSTPIIQMTLESSSPPFSPHSVACFISNYLMFPSYQKSIYFQRIRDLVWDTTVKSWT